jgi:hypothetical protein
VIEPQLPKVNEGESDSIQIVNDPITIKLNVDGEFSK